MFFWKKTNRLELLVRVQTCLSLCSEVAKHLEGVSMATLVWIYPVLTLRDRKTERRIEGSKKHKGEITVNNKNTGETSHRYR